MKLRVCTLDFETYYDKKSGYSLSNMTPEEYVRDPRFQIIGLGVRMPDGYREWITGPHKYIQARLRQLHIDPYLVIAHNMNFDGFILEEVLDVHPKMLGCTLQMARPLHSVEVGGSLAKLSAHYGIGRKGEEIIHADGLRLEDFPADQLARYGEYCLNDADLCYTLFKKLLPHFSMTELEVIDSTLRWITQPRLELDVPLLKAGLVEIRARKAAVLRKLADLLDVTDTAEVSKVLRSGPKFAALLESLGVEAPTKPSPSNPEKTTYAFAKTDPGMLELLEHEDELVAGAAEARVEEKSSGEEKRVVRFIGVGQRGTLPWPLRYSGAHTNRWSGDWLLNLQNPKKHEPHINRRSVIRDAIRAPKGYVLISSDSSQVEARVNAWLSGQDDLVDAFAQGRDPYCEFGPDAYGREITKADTTERFVCKGCILGLGFKMGAPKLKRTLAKPVNGVSADVSLEEAQRLVDVYRSKKSMIKAFWGQCREAIKAMYAGSTYEFGVGAKIRVENGNIVLPSGNVLHYPGLKKTVDDQGYTQYLYIDREGKKWKRLYDGLLTENIVQAVARDIIAWQAVQMRRRGLITVGNVHDELIILELEERAQETLQLVVEIMKSTPPWAAGCPISCEASIAARYGDC